MTAIRFDDLAALGAQVSEDFGDWGPPVTVGQETIDRYAELTGDRQWIHVDRERARSGPFGTTVAHGFLVLGLLPVLQPPQAVTPTGHAAVANLGAEGLRFLEPVPAGATIRARARLAAVTQHRRGTVLTQEIEVRADGRDKPALRYRMQLLYMR